MSMSDGDKSSFPLPSRSFPDIPSKRREPRSGDGLAAGMAQASRMTVGPGIKLKGEISNCAALVVEGDVEATLNGESLEISQRGVFSGTARVDSAEIQGRFEGDLTVSDLLRIENGGSVSGQIRYGRIEVVAGGELSGEISKVSEPEPAVVPAADVEIAAQAD